MMNLFVPLSATASGGATLPVAFKSVFCRKEKPAAGGGQKITKVFFSV